MVAVESLGELATSLAYEQPQTRGFGPLSCCKPWVHLLEALFWSSAREHHLFIYQSRWSRSWSPTPPPPPPPWWTYNRHGGSLQYFSGETLDVVLGSFLSSGTSCWRAPLWWEAALEAVRHHSKFPLFVDNHSLCGSPESRNIRNDCVTLSRLIDLLLSGILQTPLLWLNGSI